MTIRRRTAVPPIAIVQGAALWQALGFRNLRAFQRARLAGRIAMPLYPIPGQSRGFFARKDELAAYLAKRDTPSDKTDLGDEATTSESDVKRGSAKSRQPGGGRQP